jgi:glycosyltransferase involved in cell wall biosynthesis
MATRVDLHVHSKYSDRPSEWLLRRIGAPESFTEPRELYRVCRERGMDFVTVSDHNRIDGALEIAHLPGTFISCEVTTYFPEDGCKIHLLVTGIDEAQFREIEAARGSIYELRDYLYDQEIVHCVAHPLYSVNGRLTVEHFEKLLVLFKRFEGLNGARDARAGDIARLVLTHLTAGLVAELAERHRLQPRDPQPWRKLLTGGSDDHGGLHIARAWTETPPAATVAEYLGHLRAGHHEPGGEAGSSLKLAHTFYSVAHRYYRARLPRGPGRDLLAELFHRLVTGEGGEGAGERVGVVRRAAALFLGRREPRLLASDRALADGLAKLVARAERPGAHDESRAFREASRLSQQLSYAFLRTFLHHARRGRLTEGLQTLSALAPLSLCFAPYLTAFQTQHKDEPLLRAVARRFAAAAPLAARGPAKAWFTDTLLDVNGVAATVATAAGVASRLGLPLRVVTSLAEVPAAPALDFELRNFPPVGEIRLPEYADQKLAFPPFLDIIERCERERLDEVIVSTPGPVGLAGLAAARLLGLRLTGIYHTDFPAYVRTLTDSEALEQLAWSYMRWFFESMDRIYVPSRRYLELLAERGFSRQRLRVLPRGVDRERFRPERRDPRFWRRFGWQEGFTFLYVGRVSREKNLDALLAACGELQRRGEAARLAVVGDGPYLEELRRRHAGPAVLFTGYLHGDTLADAYAAADAFVFPSTTDTFGNVVLEAQASGLPVIVSDQGGPPELVAPHAAGLVVDVGRPEELPAAMLRLLRQPELRAQMAARGLAQARSSGWEALVHELWGECEAPASAPGRAAADDTVLAGEWHS